MFVMIHEAALGREVPEDLQEAVLRPAEDGWSLEVREWGLTREQWLAADFAEALTRAEAWWTRNALVRYVYPRSEDLRTLNDGPSTRV
jgi:hypothetical protein